MSLDESPPPLYPLFWDAHCHGHDEFDCVALTTKQEAAWKARLAKLKTGHVTLMGVRPDDWQVVKQVAHVAGEGDEGRVVAAYGLHPWFAHKFAEEEADWLGELERLLREDDRSIMGEIGLDRIAVTPETGKCEFDKQMQVFALQLDLAARLQKAVSVHCVRAFGVMGDILRGRKPEELPPKIMLHSYGGTDAMINSLLKLPKKVGKRVYFSFSYVINTRRSDENGTGKLESAIAAVPDDRICLESDMNTFQDLDELMMNVCEAIAKVKGWSLEETARRTFENAKRFFDPQSP